MKIIIISRQAKWQQANRKQLKEVGERCGGQRAEAGRLAQMWQHGNTKLNIMAKASTVRLPPFAQQQICRGGSAWLGVCVCGMDGGRGSEVWGECFRC